MKSNLFKRVVAVLLCLMMGLSLMSVGFTASAYHYDDDTITSYEDLNCAEDDCDCLEPDENVFKVVSAVSETSVNENYADVAFTGAYHQVQDYYKNLGQTDGMPVIPPTTLKVEKFMRYIPQADDEVIATVGDYKITAYQVAVNAVMSGCSAEYMPICIAFTKAFNNSDYVKSLADGSLTPMAFVNGPLARQLGIDNQQGMTTEEANIALGRFIEFALINLAHIERSTSFGYMQPLVFSENDAACLNVGWEPYNVQQGFGLNESTVTATSFSMWGNNVTPATDLPEEIMKVIAWDITEKNLGGLGSADSQTYADTKRVIFITPQVAGALSTLYKDKENLEDALIETARRPMWMRTYAYYYANTGGVLTGKSISEVYDELIQTEAENAKSTASPAWLIGITEPEIETGATMKKGNTIFLVTGDDSRNKTQVMPGGVSVTYKAEVSDMYESLVTSMNYQPIESYYLTATDFTVTPPSSVPSVLTNGAYRILDPSAGTTYLNREGRVLYDSSTHTLSYYAHGATAAATVALDPDADADFIAYLENLGLNSSFTVRNGKISAATIRFSSNASKPDTNTVALTAESFEDITLALHANNTENSLAAGGIAQDGSTVTMSSSITSFEVSLDGTIETGDMTDGFVTLSGSAVTVNTNAPAGSTAIIGTANSDGTYRTLTFVMKADGTYKITYNTAGTLSAENSAIYLKGAFNNWGTADPFKKTETANVYTITKAFDAGTYEFKIDANGTWYGNSGTINDSAIRWKMDSDANCKFTTAGGTYTFTFDTDAERLTVSKVSDELPDIPVVTTKTVYVGVIEYITDFVPTLHYWNNSTGLADDATLTATGETAQYAVGSAYWSNAKQNFKVYKTTIPAEAVDMKTFRISSNDRWAAEEVTYADNQIILVFEWGGTYHNFTAEYTPVVACQHANVETLNAVEATCTASGLTEGKKCLDCGEVLTKQTTIPALGHKEETIEGKDATCTETGLTEGKKCSVCGEVTVKQEVIPAKGHTEEILAYKAPTCTETGLTQGKKCSVCEEVIVKQIEIPAKGHKWNNGICENCGEACQHIYENGKCTVCGTYEFVSKLKGYSISLSGNIALNFYMTFNEEVIEDENARVVLTLPNNVEKTLYVKDAEITDEGYYVFTGEVVAKEMASVIKAQFVSSVAEGEVYEYTVKDYAEYILESNDAKYERAKPLAKAMLNYGANAQKYFNYNPTYLANEKLAEADKVLKDADLSEFSYQLTGKENGVYYYGSKLTLESETAIKHYFYIVNEDNIPVFTVNGVNVEAVKKGDYYEVKITDILAQNLDAPVVVTVGGITLDYNAFSYGYLAMQGDNAELQNVIKALYAYNQAADAYLNI